MNSTQSLLLALWCALAPSSSFAQSSDLAKPASPKVVQSADIGAPSTGPDGQPKPAFMAAHERFVAQAKQGSAQLVFLGDSITGGWLGGGGRDLWAKVFSGMKVVNFGIAGDSTQNLLWRIENGELEGFKPKAFVLLIGTNNVASHPAKDIAKGITRIVKTIREKQPQAKVLLFAIFPRGQKSSPNPYREKINAVNTIIAKLHDGERVFFLDIGEKFLQSDGSVSKEFMPDFLHLSPAGYQIWADAIAPKLVDLMK